eukprot:scaffold163480_cov26-Tisochrysis_lutea.AAC.2
MRPGGVESDASPPTASCAIASARVWQAWAFSNQMRITPGSACAQVAAAKSTRVGERRTRAWSQATVGASPGTADGVGDRAPESNFSSVSSRSET